jgi:uncharacterized protein (DUF433 family)
MVRTPDHIGFPPGAGLRERARQQRRGCAALNSPRITVAYSGVMVDWSQCPAVESDPHRVHGAWVFRDTRLPISIVFECLAKGATIEDIIQWYGGVTRDEVQQVINFVADSLEEPVHANSV